jgi:hypothetical protein
MSRNRSPLRYLPAHLVDVAQGPFALFATIAATICFITWRFARNDPSAMADPSLFMNRIVATVLTMAVLAASGAIAGTDVARGYYRAWFSKPMAPWWFYLQRWLLGGVAVLSIPVMLGVGLQLFFGKGTGITLPLMEVTALAYLLIGGTVLLASVFTARDWLFTFAITFTQARLDDILKLMTMSKTEPPSMLTWAHRLLPPYHLISPITGVPKGDDLLHVVGYGVGLVAIAVALLVVKPLGSGGRA